MKKNMIKVLWVFLIFALTPNTKGFASAIDSSLSIAPIPVSLSDYFSSSNSPLTRGARGVLRLVVSTQAGIGLDSPLMRGTRGVVRLVILSKAEIQINSPLTRGAGYPGGAWVGCVSSFHPANKLSIPGSAIASPGSYSLSLNYVSIDSIQRSKVSSNNLSDIFIPPKLNL